MQNNKKTEKYFSAKIYSPKARENRPMPNDRENTYGHLRA